MPSLSFWRSENIETSTIDVVGHEARRFRNRLRQALLEREVLAGASVGVWSAGLLILTARLAGLQGTFALRVSFLAATTGLAALVAAVVALCRTPPISVCLAALDAASAAGGLVMSAGLPGAEAWDARITEHPQIACRHRSATAMLVLALLFGLPATILPQHYFGRAARESVAGMTPLVEKLSNLVVQAESEELLPEPVYTALSNQLARVEAEGDAADPAHTLEALDHIAEELSRFSAVQAESLASEQSALQAALALAEGMATIMDENMGLDAQIAENAAQVLAQFLSLAPLSPTLSSNLMSAAAGSTNGLNAATMEELARMIREAGAGNELRLARLGELRLVDLQACRGSGSCTNAQDCAAALARLIDENGPASEAAACLASLCNFPGAGDVSRGRGDAPLTWTDPSSSQDAVFRELTLSTDRLPALEQSRLEGVSAAAPQVEPTPAAITAGALNGAPPAQGGIQQAPILPRHRETVKRFFE